MIFKGIAANVPLCIHVPVNKGFSVKASSSSSFRFPFLSGGIPRPGHQQHILMPRCIAAWCLPAARRKDRRNEQVVFMLTNDGAWSFLQKFKTGAKSATKAIY